MEERFELEPGISVLVGLGNPGKQYEATRHNAGFRVIDLLSRGFGIELKERKFPALWGVVALEGRELLLIKPTTFMNLSGEAVGPLLEYFKIPVNRMLVVHDDLDLPCGRIRLVRGGGAGGHRGVSSIKEHTEGRDFPRLKLGIGRPLKGEPVEAYVLEKPYVEEQESFEEMLIHGVEVVRAVLSEGIGAAMNRFNRRPIPKTDASNGSE